MVRSHKQSGTTYTQKVNMLSIYDKMEKSVAISFQADHKPYQFATIKRSKKGKPYV